MSILAWFEVFLFSLLSSNVQLPICLPRKSSVIAMRSKYISHHDISLCTSEKSLILIFNQDC